MEWRQLSSYRFETAEGYLIMQSRVNELKVAYVARAPRTTPILYCGYDMNEAKAACEEHLRKGARQ